jgi:hypothetical protein
MGTVFAAARVLPDAEIELAAARTIDFPHGRPGACDELCGGCYAAGTSPKRRVELSPATAR